MKCPHCKTETKFRVKETRLIEGDIVRSRCCNHCNKLFGTREIIDTTIPIGSGKGNNPRSHGNLPTVNELFKVWK